MLQPTPRLLIADSDAGVAELLNRALGALAPADTAGDGKTAIQRAATGEYALAVAELMLPRVGGLALCEGLRAAHPGIAILAVTSRFDLVPKLLGHRQGIDDYSMKPLEEQEIVHKATRLLAGGRRSIAAGCTAAAIGELQMDFEGGHLVLAGSPVRLSNREFDVVRFLAGQSPKFYTWTEILAGAWQLRERFQPRMLGIDLSALRRKLTPRGGRSSYLHIARDGWRLAEPARRDADGE